MYIVFCIAYCITSILLWLEGLTISQYYTCILCCFKCSIFCSPHYAIQKHNHIVSPLQFHRRLAQFQKEYVPPSIRPLLTHMNHPSHFLPSSHFYNTPLYGDGLVCRNSASKSNERCFKKSTPKRVDTPTDHDPKVKNNSKRGEMMSAKMRQVSPIIPHPQQRSTHPRIRGQSLKRSPNRGLRKEVQIANPTTNHSPTAGQHTHKDTCTAPTISQQPDSAIEGTSGDKFYEVSTDWMKLTIAREEEVESSIL